MFKDFKDDVDAVVERAKAAGVERIINVGCDLKSCDQTLEMVEKYEELYATLGLHPYEAADATEELMAKWEELVKKNDKIVAIGECGLDYVKAKVPKEDQKRAFRMQIELAQKVGLPVIVHNRDADEDCLEILGEYDRVDGNGHLEVVFHCFGSSVEFARKLWYRGYYTSFTGTITYPNAEDLREVVDEVPMDMFMVETDCPFLAPQEYRGKRNEPAYVVEVVKKIAEIKGLPESEIARISTENAREFFLRIR